MFNKISVIRKIGENVPRDFVTAQADIIHAFGQKNNIPVFDTSEKTTLPSDAKKVLFVSLGGDGTMLHAAKQSLKYSKSTVVGFNFGHLGFLTNGSCSVKKTLYDIKNHNMKCDSRMIIEASGNETKAIAMNEFLFAPASVHNMNTTRVFINDELVIKYRGSGVLVSTSTGSTAMAVSAGGPIISPNTNVMLIVPILAHSLSSHPIITSGRDHIAVKINADEDLEVSADGQSTQLGKFAKGVHRRNNIISIQRYGKDVHIWRTKEWQFFKTLSTKMGWK